MFTFTGMKPLPLSLQQKLRQRIENNSLRKLPEPITGIDFSSNDYLGFSRNEIIFTKAHQYLIDNKLISNGATGSRLISGNNRLYEDTESFIADFHEAEAALIFNSGYDANIGLFSCVPQKNDVILYDEYIHASIRDGIRLSVAKSYKFRHNDLEDLFGLSKKFKTSDNAVYVVTESVFSMDGDSPDLVKMIEACNENNCLLVVDEAHALGIFGKKGEGLVQHLALHEDVFARIVTFGKGLGCHGAAILGAANLKQYLINFARSFIYTTGLPPHSVATILSAYQYLAAHNIEQNKLYNNIGFFKKQLIEKKLDRFFIPSDSAIQCAVISDINSVKNIASILNNSGFAVKAILSPTVPQGKERLRFCLHSYNTHADIENVLSVLKTNLPG